MAKEKNILLRFLNGESQRSIAASLKVSRNTTAKVIDAFNYAGLTRRDLETLDEPELLAKLFPSAKKQDVVMPDFEYIHKELLKPGVTVKLLWNEYSALCRQSQKEYMSYSQFCRRYSNYVDCNKLTMHIRHKPADRLMVDWAGTTMTIKNPVTGASRKAYLFVATFPFSNYCYAEAFLDMKMDAWQSGHIHAFKKFGGTPRILVPDNLKTGVTKHKRFDDPVINQSYKEMADHYHVAVLPARVMMPKDKAAVEGCVGQLTTHVIARLRNINFFSLQELNKAIAHAVNEFNNAPFQKKAGSRSQVFYEEEQPFLQKLPSMPYECAHWKKATVQLNYHITLDYQNYSVPYTYARKKVDVRFTNKLVEVYFNDVRIASHARLHGPRGQYHTLEEHMPPNHKLYNEWDGDRFRRWAKKIGDSAFTVIDRCLNSYVIEEQSYKGCLLILKLSEKHGAERLERACSIALTRTSVPRYQLINNILVKKEDLDLPHVGKPHDKKANAFVRGASYYGGGQDD